MPHAEQGAIAPWHSEQMAIGATEDCIGVATQALHCETVGRVGFAIDDEIRIAREGQTSMLAKALRIGVQIVGPRTGSVECETRADIKMLAAQLVLCTHTADACAVPQKFASADIIADLHPARLRRFDECEHQASWVVHLAVFENHCTRKLRRGEVGEAV
jgi:hypothetical protein